MQPLQHDEIPDDIIFPAHGKPSASLIVHHYMQLSGNVWHIIGIFQFNLLSNSVDVTCSLIAWCGIPL